MTRIDEIADHIYRINTPVPPSAVPGGFSFNQYLVVDDEPLLFHTGGRRLAPAVIEAIGRVIPIEQLRWISFGHVESDECGGLNDLLAAAANARPLCGRVAAMVSMNDLADREPRAVGDGEVVSIGSKKLRWIDAPHVPHAWENGLLFEETGRTLLCGDLFTQPGPGDVALTEADILGPSEAFRAAMDYYSHTSLARATLDKIAATKPTTLACMHGSAWRGDGAKLLDALASSFSADARGATPGPRP
jgi:flavorubredoxin